MTENEAIIRCEKLINGLSVCCATSDAFKDENKGYTTFETMRKFAETCKNALEELQSYRAIGTVEELQKLKGVITDFPLDCGSPIKSIAEIWNQLKKYLAIGTIDDFKALKEKNAPKKPDYVPLDDTCVYYEYRCPSCEHPLSEKVKPMHCICGCKLDWSE